MEAANFKKKMALQQEELQLQQKQEMLNLEIELEKAKAEERAYLKIEKENHSTHSVLLQENSQTQPSPKNDQSPVQSRSVDERKHGQETPVELKDQSLNPAAKEWTDSYNLGSQLTNATERAEPSLNGATPHSSDAAYMTTIQRQQNQQLERLMIEQQRYTAALLLPQPEVPTFKCEPLEYCSFIRAFENLIETKTDSSNARLYYLVQYTAGDVQELVRSCLTMSPEEGYREARRLLKEKYGQNYKIAAAYVDRLTKGPPLKAEDGGALQKFSVLLTSCKNALKDIGYLSKLENPDALKRIVERLPYGLRQKWREVVDDVIQRQSRDVTVEDIASFVEKRARVATHPIFGNIASDGRNNDFSKPRHKSGFGTPKGSSFATKTEPNQRTTPRPSNVRCQLCNQEHKLFQCAEFRRKSLKERLQFVRMKGLCDNCLTRGHLAKTCEMPSFCRVKGCDFKHSTFLHPQSNANEQKDDTTKPTQSAKPERKSEDRPDETIVQSAYVNIGENPHRRKSRPLQVTSLAIVPVKVKAKGSSTTIETYAFLDGGSNTTFCTENLLNQLNATGRKTMLSLTTMAQEDSPIESSIVNLEVFDLNQENFIDLPTVFSTAKLPVSKENMASQQDVEKWSHLEGIEIPKIDAEVNLLIGSDVPQALEPLEIKRGQKGEPYATRTTLGWVVNGPLGRTGSAPRSASFISADVQLNEQFEKFCNMEFNDSTFSNKTSMSQEDRRALEIMNQTVKLKEGHYEVALPWRHYPPDLPNNKSLADHRLNLLKRRLTKDTSLHEKYTGFMDDLLRKGYAGKVPTEHLKGPSTPVWYLPHHPVFHPQKPDKVRVVFDCSAKCRGTSLNDHLLQGPDLTNTLVGVLTRFREEPIALMSDVEAMFHQVRVHPDDCNALRFLWWPDGDLNKPAEEFQMMAHLFGGTSSPSCANFALRKTADDNEGIFDPETIQTIRRNFYVDDCLKSVKSEPSAVRLADQLSKCLAKGGFRLTKWISNSAAVIESIPESERAPSIRKLDFDKLKHVERPLGVQWNVATDKFGFSITMKERQLTRRGVLSTVSSIYDPLGFAAPFILPAKAILQDLCRKKLGWDDSIPQDVAQRWQKWLCELPKLEQLTIDRCFKPSDFGEIASRQLHHFSDASQRGYGAVSYLRIVNTRGDIHCSFVLGKSRLAPLKPMTIPRMELSAAVVATRLENMIQQELSELTTSESVFWTDSTCVLRYIKNEDKRFQTFVANRIATIRDASSPTRYVDTKCNPADDASRGLSVESFLQERRWLKGPQFLWLPEETWPQPPVGMDGRVEDEDPEVKKTSTSFATNANTTTNAMGKIFERISSWYRLKKFVAWMMRYRQKLRGQRMKRQRGESTVLQPEHKVIPLSVDEMMIAEKEILKHVQRDSFPEEVLTLKPIKKPSTIYKLDPRKVDGLLRVGGRLRHAPIETEAKYPVILPKRHHVVELIIREYHEISGHSGLEYVLSLLRQRYWIVKARSTIRRVLNSCFSCRRRQAPVGTQKMADLPEDRVTPNVPPFTNAGVDCFGPIMV